MRNSVIIAFTAVTLVLGGGSTSFAQVGRVPNQILLTEQQFNSWILSGTGQSERPETYLESQLTLKVNQLANQIELSDEQRSRLRLAGSGDIARFHRQVEALRKTLVGQSFEPNKIQEPYQKIQPFSQQIQAGLFNENSLFDKVMRSTISSEDQEKYENYLSDRWHRQYLACVKAQIAILQQSIPMTSKQRDALVKMLDIPPRRSQSRIVYMQLYTFYRLGQLSAEDLKSEFDGAQVDALRRFGAQYAQMEPTLRAQNLLP
ncbi:hypothetical protein LOC68_01850 [Blastopirellula sp. JC732]|uniref:Uncharacterized protein n=1 Tax=Blastopirellula sediminis TaxID=2894196 RepID=A0A9X1MKH2_9BACT|nr:hypothetical protein [Blastopirellula sediminis]MCC9608068.1 hypothetical protein [Blastopirellula sediminis]MCC9627139.1 hypothetical protein [Blastopirellula sediminis]